MTICQGVRAPVAELGRQLNLNAVSAVSWSSSFAGKW